MPDLTECPFCGEPLRHNNQHPRHRHNCPLPPTPREAWQALISASMEGKEAAREVFAAALDRVGTRG